MTEVQVSVLVRDVRREGYGGASLFLPSPVFRKEACAYTTY